MNQNIPKAKFIKYLGLFIDQYLNFYEHTKFLNTKIKQYIGIFYHIRNKLSAHHLRQLYFSYVYSHLLYIMEVYGPGLDQKSISKLQVLQNKTLRALQRKNRYWPVNDLHSTFNILKVNDLIEYKTLSNIFTMLNEPDKLPSNTIDYIKLNAHLHETRNKNSLMVAKSKNKYGKRMLNSIISDKWNKLSSEIRNARNMQSFKAQFNKWKIGQYTNLPMI